MGDVKQKSAQVTNPRVETGEGILLERPRPCGKGAHLALILIDCAGDVKSAFIGAQHRNGVIRTLHDGNLRLMPMIEDAVVALRAQLERHKDSDAPFVAFGDGRTMRLLPLTGKGETMFALLIFADSNESSILQAASRYGLTNRQLEALILVLRGSNAPDIARTLCISEYTAQGYVKALLTKTGSRNRAEMVAKVLNWSVSPSAPSAYVERGSIRGGKDHGLTRGVSNGEPHAVIDATEA